MKTLFCILMAIVMVNSFSPSRAQKVDTTEYSPWNHSLDACFYFFEDDFFILPIYKVDHNWLHLEARYNYEDMNTFSAWIGYNLSGGNKFEYTITPMIGGIVGNTDGFSPGLELTFGFYGFELYSESQYVIDFHSVESNYFYMWTDFTYAPLDWLWFGISGQRTKVYQTEFEVQRGLLVGGSYRWFGLTGYIFNWGFGDPFGVITLSISLPE